ncbi:MAG: hypothetical protein ABIM40_14235 [Pseudomonadota bacterium]
MEKPACPVRSDFSLSDYEIVVLMTHMLQARARIGGMPGMEASCRQAEEKARQAALGIRDSSLRGVLESEIQEFHRRIRGPLPS